MDDAGGDPKPLPMNGLPLASRPTYQIALATALSETLGLPPRFLLLLLFFLGRCFLVPPQWSWKAEVVRLVVVVASLSERISFGNGDYFGKPILGEMRLCSRFMEGFSARV